MYCNKKKKAATICFVNEFYDRFHCFDWHFSLGGGKTCFLSIRFGPLVPFNKISLDISASVVICFGIANYKIIPLFFLNIGLFHNIIQLILIILHETKTVTTKPGQGRPGSNDNDGLLHTPQISRPGASPSDAI